MKRVGSISRQLLVLALLMSGYGDVEAQLIGVKTLPVASGDQFALFPSRNMGMANVSIALDDPLLDPFVNPGKGSRVQGSRVFAAPAFYSITDDGGAGRSLPAGVLVSSGSWFGAAALSLQELEPAERFPRFFFAVPEQTLLSEKSSTNLYAFGMLGTRLPGSGVSLGASLFWAELDAVEGVDLLYAGSQRIEQSGHLLTVRLGLLGELADDREVELLLLHSHFDMEHEVTYLDWVPILDPPLDTVGPIEPPWIQRVEENLDRTNTWGLHLGYRQPLAGEGWRIGGILTGNYKSHPKIPNYEIMNIPRDPGDSWALNLGLGVARSANRTTFGVDLILEPIWSDTWAEAAEPVTTPSGRVIPIGGRTVENEFRFTNALIRTGFGWENERAGFQLGLQIHTIDYELEQIDHIAETKRDQDESWAEWTPSWGASLRFSGFELRYAGRLTTGTGRPGVAWTPVAFDRLSAMAEAADIVAAPSGPLTLQDASVLSHQFAISIPIQD